MSSPSVPIGPDLRAALVAMVRKRVPESEVEDIVQSALAEAIESPHAPSESEALRRWIFGVAKNKVVDYHRRAGRLSYDLPELEGGAAPHVEIDMLRWAEKNLPDAPDAKKTLDWMLREGEGEKLEAIAASEKLPAPRVRQRVSRLRRHLKAHWQKEVALLAAVGVLASVLILWLMKKPEPIARDPRTVWPPPAERIREDALGLCERGEWQRCVDRLDEAKRLDPAGDTRPEIVKAREDAAKALTPPPPPSVPTTESTAPAPPQKAPPVTTESKLAKPPPQSSATPPAPTMMPKSTKPASKKADPKDFPGSSL